MSTLGKLMLAIRANNLMPWWVCLVGQKFEIFRSVVVSNTITVMHNFTRKQRTAQGIRHYQTMLKNITTLIGVWVIGPINEKVTISRFKDLAWLCGRTSSRGINCGVSMFAPSDIMHRTPVSTVSGAGAFR